LQNSPSGDDADMTEDMRQVIVSYRDLSRQLAASIRALS
jgi:hypothetical protein